MQLDYLHTSPTSYPLPQSRLELPMWVCLSPEFKLSNPLPSLIPGSSKLSGDGPGFPCRPAWGLTFNWPARQGELLDMHVPHFVNE